MSKKTGTKENYSNNTNEQINNNNNNNNDFQESVNQSLDETKDNIKKSIDESRHQIPRINNIVNSYQEESLQTAKEISEDYIDSQKQVVNSLQSVWRPYNEIFNGLVTNFFSLMQQLKHILDLSVMLQIIPYRLLDFQTTLFSQPLDAWKPALKQAKDISRHISNTGVNTARTFEQNSRQLVEDVKEVANSNTNSSY